MSKGEPLVINAHEDVALFREALQFTAAETGFAARLIEKDYFCTLLLGYLSTAAGSELVFKGGTCLTKVHSELYRLSEDLDYTIPVSVDAPRKERSNRVEVVKMALNGLTRAIPAFRVIDALKGANKSTQYVAKVGYGSLLSADEETVKIEVSLREPLLIKAVKGHARTALLNPVTGNAQVSLLPLCCIVKTEALAEKFRAALSRREPAVRDFYDIDYAVRKDGFRHSVPEFIDQVRQKLAVHGNDAINVSDRRLADLRRQVGPELRSVLRDQDFADFRRRTVSMDSLQVVPPALSDYVQVCSTATGSVKTQASGKDETRRRYVSFTRGRLSERTTPIIGYPEFEAWLEAISKGLNESAVSGDDALMRFAKPHKYNATEEPRHILFDITSEALDASRLEGTSSTVAVDKLWLIEKGKFHGEIDDKPFESRIAFNPETQRFEVESEQLDRLIVRDPYKVFTKYLNESQNFRILVGTSSVYTQGRFFTPNLLPWRGGGNRLNIHRIVVGCAGLEGIKSEKGNMTGWSTDSVFGAICDKSQVFTSAKWEPEILVCNDVGGPEIADFFGLCEKTRCIVMIHGKKAKEGSTMSASAFHEVCSQAVRYLGFFNPTDSDTKLTAMKIADHWCADPAKHPRLKRVVWAKGNPTPSEISKKFTAAIEDPTFTREVWLVMGNGLSQKLFEQAVNKLKPKPNEREMSFLFQSTWCAVASAGASLKVFCMR